MAALCNAVFVFGFFVGTVVAGDEAKFMPKAKALCHAMDAKICEQWHFDDYDVWSKEMAQFFSKKDFIYDFSSPDGPYVGIAKWWAGEHIPWNRAFPSTTFAAATGFIEAGSDSFHTVTTYAQATMVAPFKGIPNWHREDPAKKPLNVTVVDLDFYKVGNNTEGEFRILYNGCVADLYGLMVQAGYRLLPRYTNRDGDTLPEGIYYPPRTMSGIPAPNSKFVDAAETKQNTKWFREIFLGSLKTWAGISPSLFTPGAIAYANPYP